MQRVQLITSDTGTRGTCRGRSLIRHAAVCVALMGAACLVGFLVGGDLPNPSKRPAGTSIYSPAASVTPQEIDLGEVEPGTSHERVVTIRNEGRVSLKIKHISTGCGCAVAQIPERAVAPGASIDVPLRVDAPRSGGRTLRKRMTIIFDDVAMEPMRVPIICTVRAASARD